MTRNSQKKTRADYRADGRKIARHKCADTKRRKRLEKDPESWLRWYFAQAFPKPFGSVHREMLASARLAFSTGGKGVFVAPRGTGKTTLFQAYALMLLLTGEAPFPAYLPWDAKGVRKALRFWKNAVCFNDRIAADYPEYVDPFVYSKGSSQRCKVLLWDDDGEPTGAELLISGGLIVFPDKRGVIGSATINGNPRGLNHSTEDGRVWRPSFALIDDAQSKEVARSAAQVRDTLDVISTDVAGMAGPDCRMPLFLLGTILCRDDVVDQCAKRRDFHCVKVPQIVSWPARMDLWDEFGELVKDKQEDDALAFYKARAADMDAGASVSWDDRFDAARGEPNAVYSAMRDFYFMGREAFMAERQGDPVDPAAAGQYELTVEQILSHATDLPRLHVPERSTVLVGHVDINRPGLHWCIAAFDQSMTAHVAAYGNWPPRGDLWAKNATAQQRQASIYRGLVDIMGQVAAADFRRGSVKVSPTLMLVDASYEAETVHRFAESWRGPFRVMPAIGRAAHRYRWNRATLVGRPAEQCHAQRQQSRHCPYVMANVDHWREVAQRAWLAAVGEAGGCTLHAAPNPRLHVPFAEHCCAEKLAQKYETEMGWRWEWTHAVGTNWDWGDALTGCWYAAAMEGLTSGGVAEVRNKKRARVVISGAPMSKENEPKKENSGNEQKTEADQSAGATVRKHCRVVIGRRRW
jgi:hypothetical protein